MALLPPVSELHPALSAGPPVLLISIALVEIIASCWRRVEFVFSVALLYGLLVLSSLLAFLSGYPAAEKASQTFTVEPTLIQDHHVAGRLLLLSLVPLLSLFVLKFFAVRGKVLLKMLYYVALSLSVGLVVYTGFLGGRLVFLHGAGVKAPLPSASP